MFVVAVALPVDDEGDAAWVADEDDDEDEEDDDGSGAGCGGERDGGGGSGGAEDCSAVLSRAAASRRLDDVYCVLRSV